jgi:hypothetical protein
MPAGTVTVDTNWPTAASDARFTATGAALASSRTTSAPAPSRAVMRRIDTHTFE